MVINFSKTEAGNINMRLNPKNSLTHNIDVINTISKSIEKQNPIEINFVDDLLTQKLQAERILGMLANLFGGIAILISCMGLYGLVAYSAEQRTKEFAVRRVLGAPIGNIMQLLSFSFLKMVGIAAIIGTPLAYILMDKWLSAFEFKIQVSVSILATAIFAAILIAFITVCFQSYKSATADPVKALSYE